MLETELCFDANLLARSCGVCIVSWWLEGKLFIQSVDWLDWTAGRARIYHTSGSDVSQVTNGIILKILQNINFLQESNFVRLQWKAWQGSLYISVWERHLNENGVVATSRVIVLTVVIQMIDILGLDGNIPSIDLTWTCYNTSIL